MAYADYGFYITTYKGDMPEDLFDKYSEKATFVIDEATHGKAPTEMEQRLKLACCALAESLSQADNIKANSGNGAITSVSNDGYSQSYSDVSKRLSHTQRTILADYLTYPINLISGWV